jgi:hypothetical protein
MSFHVCFCVLESLRDLFGLQQMGIESELRVVGSLGSIIFRCPLNWVQHVCTERVQVPTDAPSVHYS